MEEEHAGVSRVGSKFKAPAQTVFVGFPVGSKLVLFPKSIFEQAWTGLFVLCVPKKNMDQFQPTHCPKMSGPTSRPKRANRANLSRSWRGMCSPAPRAAWESPEPRDLPVAEMKTSSISPRLLKIHSCCDHLKHVEHFHQNKGRPPFTSCNVQVYNLGSLIPLVL